MESEKCTLHFCSPNMETAKRWRRRESTWQFIRGNGAIREALFGGDDEKSRAISTPTIVKQCCRGWRDCGCRDAANLAITHLKLNDL